MPRSDDEGPHPAVLASPGGEESWDLVFSADGATLGGYVRLTLRPGRRAWFWAALVGRGRASVLVVDHDLAAPRGQDLDLRGEGLWTSLTCETPLEHWSVGLEAFGVALEDPGEAWRSLRGDRRALGLDLEWEAVASAVPTLDGYHLPSRVHGEVLLDDEVLDFDGWGGVTHAWGDQRWDQGWSTTAGRLEDGTTFAVPLEMDARTIEPLAMPGPRRRDVDLGTGGGMVACSLTPLHHAPIRIDGPSATHSYLARSLTRFATADGRSGVGWTDENHPTPGRSPGTHL